ncbi:MAG: radical SAM protein [Bacteroidales bacterium]|nr:radical SAM protein [Bacteroidales bacterium]
MFPFKKNKIKGIDWIDEFIKNIRPYVFVRLEDNILIKQPNQATQINATAAKIMKFLLDGGSTAELLKKTGTDKAEEIENFVFAVKKYLENKLDEYSLNPAVKKETFSLNFSKLPVLSELALTYKCNLTCRFCYAGCNCTVNPTGSSDELSINELKTIIDTIYKEARVPSISFTGGEPTLRKDALLACTAHAKKLGMRVNLITNSTLINEQYAKDLKSAGLDSVQVSIEGVTEETHDKLVAHKGAYKKSLNAIALFKKQDIYVHTNTTLNQINAKESLLFPEFVKNILGNERFSMNLMIPTGSSIFNEGLIIKYSEVGDIVTQIQANSKKHGVEFMWYSPIPMCMFNTITNELGNKGCAACDGLISVGANGDVLPCSSYDEPVGNLKKQSFSKIWNDDKAAYLRNKEYAHSICQSCDHLAVCNGACPLYWRNMGFEELEKIHRKKAIRA